MNQERHSDNSASFHPGDLPRFRIAVWHNLPTGGGKRAFFNQILGLKKRGHSISVWSPPLQKIEDDFCPITSHVDEHFINLRWQKEIAKLGFLRKYLVVVQRFLRRAAMIKHCKIVAEQINEGNFDVILVHPCRFFRTSPLASFTKVPTILYLQEPQRLYYESMPELFWRDSKAKAPLRMRFLDPFFRGIIKTAKVFYHGHFSSREIDDASKYDSILVNSLFSRESIVRSYALDAELCDLGVDTDFFSPNQEIIRKNFVLSVGSIIFSKGLDRTIRAISAIPKNIRPTLKWIGNFADPSYLGKMIELAKNCEVDFQPRIATSDDELLHALREATIFLYLPRLEPFGYAPIEAGCCETPVVAVAEGGIRESIVDGVNGLLALDAKPQTVAEKLIVLLSDRAKAQALGRSARAWNTQRWGLDRAAEQLEIKLRLALFNSSANR